MMKLSAKYFLLFGIVAFLLLSMFGPALSMPMSSDGHMTGCPFMGTSVCQMTPFEHLGAWQNMFTTTAPESTSALVLLLLMAVALFVFSHSRLLFPEIRASLPYQPPDTFFKNLLQEAFSKGILNSKAY